MAWPAPRLPLYSLRWTVTSDFVFSSIFNLLSFLIMVKFHNRFSKQIRFSKKAPQRRRRKFWTCKAIKGSLKLARGLGQSRRRSEVKRRRRNFLTSIRANWATILAAIRPLRIHFRHLRKWFYAKRLKWQESWDRRRRFFWKIRPLRINFRALAKINVVQNRLQWKAFGDRRRRNFWKLDCSELILGHLRKWFYAKQTLQWQGFRSRRRRNFWTLDRSELILGHLPKWLYARQTLQWQGFRSRRRRNFWKLDRLQLILGHFRKWLYAKQTLHW